MDRPWRPGAPQPHGFAGGYHIGGGANDGSAGRGAYGGGGYVGNALALGGAGGGMQAVPAIVEGLLGSMCTAFERIVTLSSASCGACGKDMHPSRQQKLQDSSLAHLFIVKSLSSDGVGGGGGGMEAARATHRGSRLAHDGRLDEALRELHDARQMAPGSYETCNNLGCTYFRIGDDNSSLHWYRESHRLNPKGETAAQAIAFLEQRRGCAGEAQRILVSFLQDVDASNIGALRQLGKLHVREEHWSKAAGCYHKLIAVDPSNREWPTQLELCLKNLPVKDDDGEPVRDPNGAAGGGMFALAFSYAEPLIRGAADEPPGGREAPRHGGQDGGIPAMHKLSEAKSLLEAGRADAAISVYEGILRHNPRSSDALLGLADSYADLGKLDSALEAGKQLLGVRPDDAEANLRVAELLLAANYNAEMVEPYLKWASNTPNGGRTLRIRMLCATAEVALLREDYAKAHASASEAVRVDAEMPRALLLLGHARLRCAEYSAALRALSAASNLAGAHSKGGEARRLRATAHALAAEAQERQRQYPQALAEVQKALDLCPQLNMARIVRATVFQQSGRGREAESELEQVLRNEPESAAARLALGYCQLCAGASRSAISTLEGVVTSSGATRSSLGSAKVYLAIALDSQGELDPRSGAQQRAAMLVKEGLAAHRNLQQVWKELDNNSGAQASEVVQKLRGICDLDLTGLQAKQLLRLLARATGRQELAGGFGPPTPGGLGGASSRENSMPPTRWAPLGGIGGGGGPGSRGSRSGTSTPLGHGQGACTPLGTSGGFSQWNQRSVPATPQQGYRGRSMSPRSAAGTPYGDHGRSCRASRDASPNTPSMSDPLTIAWNELIRPEQLVFGAQLGAGGSAAVFRGSWNGQEVAIKKISGVAHLDEMRKEVNALRRLRHPRLVRFIGACVQPPMLLVVTEFMPGGSLHDRLFGSRRDHTLALMQRWLISCHTAEGLTFLHSQRVVHRDLKSMNILLDAQQNAKICDFGLAQQMPEMATHIQRKIEGEEGGSPRYMAPECYDAAHGKITEKVDVWAMGCILIELFGGVLPYGDCQSMAQLTKRILLERRSPDVPHCVPPQLAPLIRRCVNFEPHRRFNANELQLELSRLRPGNC